MSNFSFNVNLSLVNLKKGWMQSSLSSMFLKRIGESWISFLAQNLHNPLELIPCRAYPGILHRPDINYNGGKYYKHIIIYAGVMLVISKKNQINIE